MNWTSGIWKQVLLSSIIVTIPLVFEANDPKCLASSFSPNHVYGLLFVLLKCYNPPEQRMTNNAAKHRYTQSNPPFYEVRGQIRIMILLLI